MALIRMNFESIYLNNNHEIGIILPDMKRGQMTARAFYESGKKYKVLWLLHGTFGDYSDWIRKSNIERYAAERDLIVVMPSGLNSNFDNWNDAFGMGYDMYSYLFEELMPMVYNWFPASEKREDNFIAGLSMGGMGAVSYGLQHPEKFAGIASLSAPCFHYRKILQETPLSELDVRVAANVKNAGGPEKFLDSVQNTWDLLPKRLEEGVLPKLYFCIGTEDFMYQDHLVFKEYAEKENIPIFFEEEAGYGHEWAFWDRYIQRALDYFEL